MTITAKTDCTLANLRLFQRAAAWQLAPGHDRRLRIAYLGLGLGALAVGGYYAVSLVRGDQDLVSILLAGLGLYWGGALLWMAVRYYDYFAGRALRSIPENARRNYFSFEDDQIVVSNRLRSGSYPYRQFGLVCETRECFLFFISGRSGYILEKSGLENATPAELRALLDRRLSAPVRELPEL